MHKLIVVTFPDAVMARRGTDTIKKLHAERSIKIYGAVLAARDPSGNLSILEVTKRGHGATVAGALIGGLAGLPLGPVAMTIGAAGGALIGHSAELLHEGDAAELVQKVSRSVDPGKAVIVVEIAKDGLTGFAELMKRMGGAVVR